MNTQCKILLFGAVAALFSLRPVPAQEAAPKAEAPAQNKAQNSNASAGQTAMDHSTQDDLGAKLNSSQLEALPVNGLNFIHLFSLVPGVSVEASNTTDGSGTLGQFSINGNRGRANDYLLDGTDLNDSYRNRPSANENGVYGVPLTVLPLDSIHEVNVVSNAEAETGRHSGAKVDFVTKSGSNDLHGSLYEYFRNNGLDARNYFDPASEPASRFQNNQFGASLGGPLVKNKTFFFGSYEGQRENVGFLGLSHVPTAAEIQQAIADNGGVVNPVIANLLALNPWPSPNIAPDAQGNNLLESDPSFATSNSGLIRVDHHFNDRNFLTARYFHGGGTQSFPLTTEIGTTLPGYNTVANGGVNTATVAYAQIFSAALLNEVRFGFNRFTESTVPQDSNFNPLTQLGLNTGVGPRDFGLPTITVGNFGRFGPNSVGTFATLGANISDSIVRTSNDTQIFDTLSYTKGRHNWKFGYEFRHIDVDSLNDRGYRGLFSFDGLDSFIAGIPTLALANQGDSSRQTFQNTHAFFVQDNYSLTSSLTLNYGLRWDYFGVIGESNGLFSNVDANGNLQLTNQLYPKDLNNFAPRGSLAWKIDNKTVLRAGAGLYYDDFSQDIFLQQHDFATLDSGPARNDVGPKPVTEAVSGSGPLLLNSPTPFFFQVPINVAGAFTVAPNLRTPYVGEFNLNIERAFGDNVAFRIGYVGSQGRKLLRVEDINQVNPATGQQAFPQFGGIGSPVNQIQSSSRSNFNALQTSLRLLNLHGFTSTVNYQWSHSIDLASDAIDLSPDTSKPDNSFNPVGDRANSNFDERHQLNWNFFYTLPSFQTWHMLTSGWSVSGNWQIHSGQPFNVNFDNLISSGGGFFNGTANGVGRPDLVGNPFAGTDGRTQFLNLSAFQLPCNVDATASFCQNGGQHFGNLGRNAFVGPGLNNFDFSVTKETAVNERIKLRLRLDAFNFFNHPNFANPELRDFSVLFSQNGLTSTGQGVGFLSITQTPDVAVGSPFLAGGGPRSLQLSARFTF